MNLLKFIATLSMICFLGTACVAEKGKTLIDIKRKSAVNKKLDATVSSVQIINNQVVIHGTGLTSVTIIKIDESALKQNFIIQTQTATEIIANAANAFSFDVSKVFNLILSDANASIVFPIDFSLCNATLNGYGFECRPGFGPNDKEVLSFDFPTKKWVPRAVNGLSYQGVWDASGAPPSAAVAGEYFIVSVAGAGYNVGDWSVFNGATFEKIGNANSVVSVYGRTGNVVATKGDYSLTKLSDVDVTTVPPSINQVLKFDGSTWIPGAVTDSSVSAFARAALPVCAAGEVLKSNGSVFSCVAGGGGGSAFTSTANRAVVTNGAGALAVSAITDTVLGYLSGATSNIQSQINNKLDASSFVNWQITGVQTLEPTRLNLGTANRVVVTSGTGVPTASGTSVTELGYVNGVTSSIQTQLNGKIATETDPLVSAFAKTTLPLCTTGEVLSSNGVSFSCVTDNTGSGAFTGTVDKVVLTDATTGVLTTSAVTSTELGYVAGVTSSIQTQLGTKQNTISKTTTQDVSKLRIYGANGTNYVELNAATLTGNRSLIFPDSNGATGNVLTTNGAGVLSWTAPTGGGVPSGTAGGDLSGTYPNPTISGLSAAKISTGTVSNTEFNYLAGVTSAIQTQLNGKIATETDPLVSAFAKTTLPLCTTGEVLSSNGVSFSCVTDNTGSGAYTGTVDKVVLTDATTGVLTTSAVTSTELGYVAGVTSSIQTQLGTKQNTISKTTTQDVSKLRIYGANGTNYVELNAATLTGNRSLIFPDSDGASGNVLTTNGAGALSWISIPSAPVTTVNGAAGAVVLTAADLLITAPTLTNSAISAGDSLQVAVGKLQAQENAKQGTITVGTTSQYYRGDKTFVTLDTLAVAENTNLYFTASRAKAAAVADAIADAVVDVAPSQNAVFDALALKMNLTGGTLSVGTISGVPTPLNADDVANKDYVDNAITTNGSKWTLSAGNVSRTSGKVGIGTSTPGTLLELQDSTASPKLTLNNTSAAADKSNIIYFNKSGTNLWGIVNDFAQTGAQNFQIRDYVSSQTRFIIDGSGNVGLGTTTTMTDKLEVVGNAQVTGKLRLKDTGTHFVELSAPTTATANYTLIFPATAGTSNQVLTTDGSGVLSWTTPTIGGAPTGAAGGDLSGTYPNPTISGLAATKISSGTVSNTEFDYLAGVTSPIQTQLAAKEGTITAGTTSQYLRGDKTFVNFASDVLASLLNGLSTATNSVITAADSVITGFGKLQAQITSLGSTKLDKTGGTLSVGTINGVPTPVNSDDVVNKSYVDGRTQGNWSPQTSSFTAVKNGRYLMDTSSGAITITLPSSATVGDTIQILDAAGTFDSNNLTVGRNGLKIMGLAEDMTVSTKNVAVELVYYNATNGWRVK